MPNAEFPGLTQRPLARQPTLKNIEAALAVLGKSRMSKFHIPAADDICDGRVDKVLPLVREMFQVYALRPARNRALPALAWFTRILASYGHVLPGLDHGRLVRAVQQRDAGTGIARLGAKAQPWSGLWDALKNGLAIAQVMHYLGGDAAATAAAAAKDDSSRSPALGRGRRSVGSTHRSPGQRDSKGGFRHGDGKVGGGHALAPVDLAVFYYEPQTEAQHLSNIKLAAGLLKGARVQVVLPVDSMMEDGMADDHVMLLQVDLMFRALRGRPCALEPKYEADGNSGVGILSSEDDEEEFPRVVGVVYRDDSVSPAKAPAVTSGAALKPDEKTVTAADGTGSVTPPQPQDSTTTPSTTDVRQGYAQRVKEFTKPLSPEGIQSKLAARSGRQAPPTAVDAATSTSPASKDEKLIAIAGTGAPPRAKAVSPVASEPDGSHSTGHSPSRARTRTASGMSLDLEALPALLRQAGVAGGDADDWYSVGGGSATPRTARSGRRTPRGRWAGPSGRRGSGTSGQNGGAARGSSRRRQLVTRTQLATLFAALVSPNTTQQQSSLLTYHSHTPVHAVYRAES